MLTYNGNPATFHPDISIFEAYDLVLGDIDGTSNVPIKELADNVSHLKKFKGNLFDGNGIPSDSIFPVNFVIDSDTNSNTLYYDKDTGAFWKRTGTNAWTNIGKGAILNVKGVRLNNNGNDSQFVTLQYNHAQGYIELKDSNNVDYADLRVGTLRYDDADGSSNTISQFIDKEILILASINTHAENSDGYFSVKNLIDQPGNIIAIKTFANNGYDRFHTDIAPTVSVGDYVQVHDVDEDTSEHINRFYKVSAVNNSVIPFYFEIDRTFSIIDSVSDRENALSWGGYSKDNAAQLRWDNTNNRFELRRRDGTLLGINVSTFLINGIPVGFTANRIIARESDFDALFNHVINANTNECYLRKPETNYADSISDEFIYVKKSDNIDGSYTLNAMVVIEGSNVKIEFAPGVTINFNDTNTNPNSLGQTGNIGFRFQNNTVMPINQYRIGGPDNYFQILARNYYFTNGPHALSQTILPSIEHNDRIFAFTETTNVTSKYTAVNNVKEFIETPLVNENRTDVGVTLSGTWDVVYKVVGGINKAYVAHVDGTSIKINDYTLDFDTGTIVKSVLGYTINISFVPDELKFVIGNSKGVILATKHADSGGQELAYKQIDLTAPSNTLGAALYTSSTLSDSLSGLNGCIVNDTDLYVIGNQSSQSVINIFKATLTTNAVLDSILNLVTTLITDQDTSLQIKGIGAGSNGSTAYFSWGYIKSSDSTLHQLKLTYGNNASWTTVPISLTNETFAGIYSDLIIVDDPNNIGQKLIHVAYTNGSVANKQQNLDVVIVDPNNSYSYVKNVLSLGLSGINFTNVEFYNNISNTYKGSNLITIGAVRPELNDVFRTFNYLNNYGTNHLIPTLPSNQSIRNKIQWTGGTRISPFTKVKVFGANNNAGFIAGADGTSGLFFQYIDYAHSIQIVEPVAYGSILPNVLTVFISNDYIENSEIVNLKINQLGITFGPSVPNNFRSYIEIANCINCKITKLSLFNCKYAGVIFGGTLLDTVLYPKTYGCKLNEISIDNTNTINSQYIAYINSSDINGFNFNQVIAPTKNLLNIRNVNIQGILNDGTGILGNGNFDL